jgi:hypothetical protein
MKEQQNRDRENIENVRGTGRGNKKTRSVELNPSSKVNTCLKTSKYSNPSMY